MTYPSEHVAIFDTTLRDGQQCPGAGMSFENCLKYARLAAALHVDALEAGFPAASKLDFSIVERIADELGNEPYCPIIAALCQLRSEQIDRTVEALMPAVRRGKARLHVYLPVDPNLLAASLGDRAEDKRGLVAEVHALVQRAASAGCEVEFSPEGYSRQGANHGFTTDCIRAAIAGGASVINCPDTIGGACKFEGRNYFVEQMKRHAEVMRKEFPDKRVIWSTHCHNDFGLAVENSLNAVVVGPARQIEGCINGIGERAGNAALEQCIMVLKHFGTLESSQVHFSTQINTEKLQEISDFVARHMLPRQPHWPVSGTNAARHSSGGHTNAILKNPLVYQPFDPKETGSEISLAFGPLSGGNHAKAIIEGHGFRCTEDEKAQVAQFIKDFYADRRKGITDEELIKGYVEYRKPIDISAFDYARHSNTCEVTIEGKFFSRSGKISERSTGPDSALATLKNLIDQYFPGLTILSYHSDSAEQGISSASVSRIAVSNERGERFEGVGEEQDIEISAMRALIDAVNTAYVHEQYRE